MPLEEKGKRETRDERERLIFADEFQLFKRARPGKARRLLIVPFKNKLVK